MVLGKVEVRLFVWIAFLILEFVVPLLWWNLLTWCLVLRLVDLDLPRLLLLLSLSRWFLMLLCFLLCLIQRSHH